jgi:hypothetical protein
VEPQRGQLVWAGRVAELLALPSEGGKRRSSTVARPLSSSMKATRIDAI